ncbi:KH domain protein [Chlamydia ibidis]|uniref:RNA-binding protein KhpA n=2 Tax=Chlamydia ibidis TaxID=1405396 RepID=S7J2P8_9CHLA|nr:KH domain-containing protein [Chlamydia ibidis]EPP34694.1 KH domain protein [Chlamydia ibidis]EQM62453.1 KH domain protein [Chlamydia ibidis 10-1398/6]
MEEFVAYIVKNLVADPEAVEIRSIEDEANESIKLEIRVAPDDIGKIIGRRGNTIHALRTILRRVCARLKKKIQIDLIQPETSEDTVNSIASDFCSNSDSKSDISYSSCCVEATCCTPTEDVDIYSENESVCDCNHDHPSA